MVELTDLKIRDIISYIGISMGLELDWWTFQL